MQDPGNAFDRARGEEENIVCRGSDSDRRRADFLSRENSGSVPRLAACGFELFYRYRKEQILDIRPGSSMLLSRLGFAKPTPAQLRFGNAAQVGFDVEDGGAVQHVDTAHMQVGSVSTE